MLRNVYMYNYHGFTHIIMFCVNFKNLQRLLVKKLKLTVKYRYILWIFLQTGQADIQVSKISLVRNLFQKICNIQNRIRNKYKLTVGIEAIEAYKNYVN